MRPPPTSDGPSCVPPGAEPEMPSGRSAGTNDERCTVSAYPVALLLATVTRSEMAEGVSPDTAFPKLTVGRSRAIERTGWISMSTAAGCETLPAGGDELHEAAADDELRGDGVAVEKSAEFTFVSVQPEPPRTAAVVLLSAGAGPAPS